MKKFPKSLLLMLFSGIACLAPSAHARLPIVKDFCQAFLGKRVLIVDGYSTGADLAPYLRAKGIHVDHLHSNGDPINVFKDSFQPQDYSQDFHPGSYPDAVEVAYDGAYDAIIPGAESAVLMAARLNAELGLSPSRTVEFTWALRDKFLMGEILRAAGISAVEQTLARDVDTALNWIRQKQYLPNGRVVLKPPMSGASDSVFVCHNEDEVRHAFEVISKLKNVFEIYNEGVLVQEYLTGTEYAVNTVSSAGVHKVSDIWRYYKDHVGDRVAYDRDELLSSQGPLADKLIDYARQVLDALHIHTGWGHIEIKLTHRGPVLVEIGNRMMGAHQPLVVTKALGTGPIEMGHLAFLEHDKFLKLPDRYRDRKGATVVTLNAVFDHAVFDGAANDRIRSLPGYVSHSFAYTHGQTVTKTTNLMNALGHVEFVHDDPQVLQESARRVKEWVHDRSFYLPEPLPR